MGSFEEGTFEVGNVDEARVVATWFPYLGEDLDEVGGGGDHLGMDLSFFP